jgi:YggT family protein
VILVQIVAGTFFALLWLLVLGRVLMSWVDPRGTSSPARVLYSVTEPLIAPVRRLLPPSAMFDFSTLLVLVVLGVIWRALL